jgi:hypothetical protein
VRVASLGVARPAPIDRNNTTTVNAYGARGTAPHVQTSRFSQTIASGKKGSLTGAMAYVQRTTAATTVTFPNIIVTLNTGAGNNPLLNVQLRDNVVGTVVHQVYGGSATFAAGTVISAFSEDGSTGGTIDYFATAVVQEFDA